MRVKNHIWFHVNNAEHLNAWDSRGSLMAAGLRWSAVDSKLVQPTSRVCFAHSVVATAPPATICRYWIDDQAVNVLCNEIIEMERTTNG